MNFTNQLTKNRIILIVVAIFIISFSVFLFTRGLNQAPDLESDRVVLQELAGEDPFQEPNLTNTVADLGSVDDQICSLEFEDLCELDNSMFRYEVGQLNDGDKILSIPYSDIIDTYSSQIQDIIPLTLANHRLVNPTVIYDVQSGSYKYLKDEIIFLDDFSVNGNIYWLSQTINNETEIIVSEPNFTNERRFVLNDVLSFNDSINIQFLQTIPNSTRILARLETSVSGASDISAMYEFDAAKFLEKESGWVRDEIFTLKADLSSTMREFRLNNIQWSRDYVNDQRFRTYIFSQFGLNLFQNNTTSLISIPQEISFHFAGNKMIVLLSQYVSQAYVLDIEGGEQIPQFLNGVFDEEFEVPFIECLENEPRCFIVSLSKNQISTIEFKSGPQEFEIVNQSPIQNEDITFQGVINSYLFVRPDRGRMIRLQNGKLEMWYLGNWVSISL